MYIGDKVFIRPLKCRGEIVGVTSEREKGIPVEEVNHVLYAVNIEDHHEETFWREFNLEVVEKGDNSNMKIVRLGSVKFFKKDRSAYCVPEGYAFYHESKGYLSFKEDNKSEPYTPYVPRGGKKALQNILDQGGLLHYDDVEWLSGE